MFLSSDPSYDTKDTFFTLALPTPAYFFAAAASSALALALFSLTPTRRASLLAKRRVRYAFSVPSGNSLRLISETASACVIFLIGCDLCVFVAVSMSPLLAFATSSLLLSPLTYLPDLRGKTITRARYSLRRATFSARASVDKLARRGSTLIPIVGAYLRGMPAS